MSIIAYLIVEEAIGCICTTIETNIIIETVEAATQAFSRDSHNFILNLIEILIGISIIAEGATT
jgi:hypothetical protein